MVFSLRQVVSAVAAISIFCGIFRLADDAADVVWTNPKKIINRASFKQKPMVDYNSCLANLSGLEQALVQAAAESRIDPKLLLAVMTVESDCSLASISSRGAVGLMQILPSTAMSVGKFNAHLPKDNIRAGAKYLRELKDRFGPDLSLTLAAYNAGPSAVRRYKGIPPYRETRNYVAKVLKIYQGYRL